MGRIGRRALPTDGASALEGILQAPLLAAEFGLENAARLGIAKPLFIGPHPGIGNRAGLGCSGNTEACSTGAAGRGCRC